MNSDDPTPLPSDIENLVLNHYVTLNKYGEKGIDVEVIGKDTASYRFLKKLERKRLASACNIIIDMRGKQPEKTTEFLHQGRIHHLDKKSLEIFEQKASEFNGAFTQGVYEAVLNADHTFKQVQKQQDEMRLEAMKTHMEKGFEGTISDEPSEYDDLPPERFFIHKKDLLQFGCLVIRKESRLMYVTEVEINQPGKAVVFGKSKDLSVNGLYVTLSAEDMSCRKGQTFTVRLPRFEQDLGCNDLSSIFRILNVEEKKGTLHVRLQRIDEASSDDYVPIVSKFVADNVRRYKADFQDVIEQTAARIYEHNYCQNFIDLPMIVSRTRADYAIEAVLVNELNHGLVHQLTEKATASSNNLNTLVSHVLHSVLVKPGLDHAETLIGSFSFKDKAGKTSLYLACDNQYASADEQKKFLAVGKHCSQFKVFKVLMTKLSDEQTTKAGNLLDQIPEYEPLEIQAADYFVERCQFLVVIQDVTAAVKPKLVPNVALSENQLQMATTAFKKFIKKPVSNTLPLLLAIGYKPCRKEPRFLYELEVKVSHGVESFRGSTIDLSVHGLGIILDEAAKFEIGDVVTVALPSLAERTKDDTLLELIYTVRGRSVDRRELYLYQREPDKGEHRAKSFFKMLISKNKDKLNPCPKEDILYFQTKLSQIFLIDNLLSMPFFLGKKDKQFTLNSLGYNSKFNTMLTGFEVEPDLYEIPFLMDPKNVEFMVEKAKAAEQLNHTCFQTVMFSYMDKSKAYQVKFLDKDFANPRALSDFIEEHKDFQNFHVLLLKIKPVIPFNKTEFEIDLNKVRVHSINRYRKLVEEIDSLHYVGELIRIDELFI
jgi:hypothetical protein